MPSTPTHKSITIPKTDRIVADHQFYPLIKRMENKRPELAIADQSILSLVTELHTYFRDMQSYYKMTHGEMLSRLEAATDPATEAALHQQIKEINEKIIYFHVLNNAISTVDTVLHTEKMIVEFKPSSNPQEFFSNAQPH
jgi:hypothetical protein